MDTVEKIKTAIEQLKKEVWYIAKVTIPQILSSLGDGSSEDLKKLTTQVESNTASVLALENDLSLLKTNFEEVSSGFNTLSQSLTTLASDIEGLESKQSSLDSALSTLETNYEGLIETLQTLTSNLDSVLQDVTHLKDEQSSQNEAIRSNTAAAEENAENIKELGSKLETVQASLTDCKTQVEETVKALENSQAQISTNSTKIENILEQLQQVNSWQQTIVEWKNSLTSWQSGVDSWKASFEAWKNSIDSWKGGIETSLTETKTKLDALLADFGEIVEVVYDMSSSDPDINKGFTSGMTYGSNFNITADKYKKIRVFASLNNTDARAECYLVKRKHTNILLQSANTTLNKVYYMQAAINSAGTIFTVSISATYDINASTGAMTFTRENKNTSAFVYRVEGVY